MRLLRFVRWLWTRCHPFTWLVAVMVTAALVLIVVPGESLYSSYRNNYQWQGDAAEVWTESWGGEEALSEIRVNSLVNDSGPDLSVSLYGHGWPWPYLTRGVCTCENSLPSTTPPAPAPSEPLLEFVIGESFADSNDPWVYAPVGWSNYDNWPFRSEAYRLHVWTLLGDLLVAGAILAGIVLATERWVRRRGSFYRLRIVDLLVLTAVVAVTLTWFEGHRQKHQTEREVQAYLVSTHTSPFPSCFEGPSVWVGGEEYCGPVWLRRLVGNRAFLPQLDHYTFSAITVTPNWKEDFEQLKLLPELDMLRLQTPVTAEVLASLVDELPLSEVEIELAHVDGAYHRQVAENLGVRADELLSHDNIEQLASLSIETLAIRASDLLVEDLERLLAAGLQAETLRLDWPAITVDEYEVLRQRYPETRLVVQWRNFSSRSLMADETNGDQDDYVEYVRKEREEMKMLQAMKLEQENAESAE